MKGRSRENLRRSSHWKTPVLESLFNKIADLQACIFIKRRLLDRCLPENFAKFSRTSILNNIWKRLLRLIPRIRMRLRMTRLCLFGKAFQNKEPLNISKALFHLLELQQDDQVTYFSLLRDLAQVFSCEFSEIFKSNFLVERRWEIAFALN